MTSDAWLGWFAFKVLAETVLRAQSADLYVANGGIDRVSAVDARTLREIAAIKVGRRPWSLVVSRDGRWLYTANGLSNDVSVVDLTTGVVVKTFRAGERPWGIALVY